MSARITPDRSELRSPPGWHVYGAPSRFGLREGQAWSGDSGPTSLFAAPPPWSRTPSWRRFRWLVLFLSGQLLIVAAALLAVASSQYWGFLLIVGFTVEMWGAGILVSSRLSVDDLPARRRLVAIGIASGLLATVLAVLLEAVNLHNVGASWSILSAGPIEESSKLLVPLALLSFGSAVVNGYIRAMRLIAIARDIDVPPMGGFQEQLERIALSDHKQLPDDLADGGFQPLGVRPEYGAAVGSDDIQLLEHLLQGRTATMARAYPQEFRDDAVAVARKGEAPISQIAKDFGISEATLHNWR